MAGKYMPPHMRLQTPSTPLHQPTQRNPSDGYTLEEIAYQLDCKHKVGTLNSNADKGQEWDSTNLAFVVLFKNQHPEWPNRLFCKSNLNLLPGGGGGDGEGVTEKNGEVGEQDGADEGERTKGGEEGEGLSNPIPVFTEAQFSHSKRVGGPGNQHFLFSGYYVITSVTLLEPESPELITLLDKKFSPEGKRRSADAWKASLALKWAVVELELTGMKGLGCEGEGEVEHRNPMVPLKEVKKRGVSEMLEAMRLGEEAEEGKENIGFRGRGHVKGFNGRGGGRGRGAIVGTQKGRASWGKEVTGPVDHGKVDGNGEEKSTKQAILDGDWDFKFKPLEP